MRKCGCNDDNVSKLLCVKCNVTEFEIMQKLDSGEFVARCKSCGQETDLGVIIGTRYEGAIELVAALKNLYAVASYKAKKANDEIGTVRNSRKYDLLETMLTSPGYVNPLNIAIDLFSMIENSNISLTEAEKLIETALREIAIKKK